MASSIFSSEKRSLLALLTAAVISLLLGIVNIVTYINISKQKDGSAAEDRFYRLKIIPEKKHDMVFIGDSRVITGINPEIFERKLNCSAYNCAFFAGSANETIYKLTADKHLSSDQSRNRAVVIGITPMVMAESTRSNGQFINITQKFSRNKNIFAKYFKILFKKIRTKDVKSLFIAKVPSTVFHENGFLERFAKVSRKAQQSSMNSYKIFFENYQFSHQSLLEMQKRIESWKKENITVFAFRPPVNIEMDTLENNAGKCDFAHIRKAIEAAGGVWLEVENRSQYTSYDSSHLASAEARRLSEDLAEKISLYFQHHK